MIKLLFICHGNICRSPLAEFLAKDFVKKTGADGKFYIESAATSCEELGNPVHPVIKRKLAKIGIDVSGKYARRVQRSDLSEFDYFICMDSRNTAYLSRMFPKEEMPKLLMLGDYCKVPCEIDDPWYSGEFDTVFSQIYEACDNLIDRLCKKMDSK